MALSHDFSIIEKKYDNGSDDILAIVSISDVLIQYMKDSLCWIDAKWNGIKVNKGLNYYGYTLIDNQDIYKFKNIINSWLMLFESAPEKFVLTGNYIIDENKYEKNILVKEDVILQLKSLRNLCDRALCEGNNILHDGI